MKSEKELKFLFKKNAMEIYKNISEIANGKTEYNVLYQFADQIANIFKNEDEKTKQLNLFKRRIEDVYLSIREIISVNGEEKEFMENLFFELDRGRSKYNLLIEEGYNLGLFLSEDIEKCKQTYSENIQIIEDSEENIGEFYNEKNIIDTRNFVLSEQLWDDKISDWVMEEIWDGEMNNAYYMCVMAQYFQYIYENILSELNND